MRGCNAATRRVVVSAKMRGDTTAARGRQQKGRLISPRALMIDCVVSIIISIFNEPAGKPVCFSSKSKRSASALTCSGIVIFGKRNHEIVWQLALRTSRPKSKQKCRGCASCGLRSSSVKGLMRMPIKGGSVLSASPCSHFAGRGARRDHPLLRRGDCHNHLQSRCESLRLVRAVVFRSRGCRSRWASQAGLVFVANGSGMVLEIRRSFISSRASQVICAAPGKPIAFAKTQKSGANWSSERRASAPSAFSRIGFKR